MVGLLKRNSIRGRIISTSIEIKVICLYFLEIKFRVPTTLVFPPSPLDSPSCRSRIVTSTADNTNWLPFKYYLVFIFFFYPIYILFEYRLVYLTGDFARMCCESSWTFSSPMKWILFIWGWIVRYLKRSVYWIAYTGQKKGNRNVPNILFDRRNWERLYAVVA